MKILNTSEYNEKLNIRPVNPSNLICYKHFPETEKELIEIIDQRVHDEGYECDLNDIDTSKITDMFKNARFFNNDISRWNVSSVNKMEYMFHMAYSFDQDLSKWNVSNVTNMNTMLQSSNFNHDVSNWNVEKVKTHNKTFNDCPIDKHPEKQPTFKK